MPPHTAGDDPAVAPPAPRTVAGLAPGAMLPRVSVVIPTLNEAANLEHVLPELPAGLHEVVLVDGGSSDGTCETARRLWPDIRCIRQTRSGKGNALACGFAACTGDIIVMLDADGSADPAEIPSFVAALLAGADFAKGTRFAGRGGSADITRLRALGNRALTLLVNLSCRTRYSDLCYGYNAFWKAACLPVLELDWRSPAPAGTDGRLWGDGFEIETLINVRIAGAGLRVAEVPSYERPRLHGASNLNAASDGLRVLRTIAVERRRARAARPAPKAGPQRRPVLAAAGPSDAPLATPRARPTAGRAGRAGHAGHAAAPVARPALRAIAGAGHAMSVALVAPRFAPTVGGMQTHVLELARRLSASGVAVEVLTQTDDAALPAVEVLDDFVVRRFPVLVPSRNFAVAPGLPRFLAGERGRYDLIHAHSYHALPALGCAALAGPRPFVFTPHYHGTGHSPLRAALHRPYRLAGRRLFERADRVICVSQAEADLVTRHFPAVAGRVTVVPNGVDAADIVAALPFATAVRPRPRSLHEVETLVAPHERLLLTVGRLEGYKNVDAVIGALGELEERYSLCVVGDGSAAARLRGRLDARLFGRVLFVGRIERAELCRWYRTAAVYVNASAHEAFGIGALEALAGGAAVVLSDIPAHREVAERYAGGRARLVDRPRDPACLAAAIRAAADAGGRAPAAVALPSWDDVADRTLDLYRSALRRGPARETATRRVA